MTAPTKFRKLDLSYLPSSLRSLLDERSLSYATAPPYLPWSHLPLTTRDHTSLSLPLVYPPSLTALLVPRGSFLLELWRVLNRDEPQTALSLMHPGHEDGGALGGMLGSAVGAGSGDTADPLATARCDAIGEALGAALKPSGVRRPVSILRPLARPIPAAHLASTPAAHLACSPRSCSIDTVLRRSSRQT